MLNTSLNSYPTLSLSPKAQAAYPSHPHGKLQSGESKEEPMYQVLIVDDHAVVRRGLRQIVAEESETWQAAEACNAAQAMQLLQQKKWDVVILDLTMPDKNGLDLLVDIKRDYPHLPCLMLSMHPEDQFALRALKLGASGYLTKETAPDELLSALRKVVSGGRYVSQSLAEKLHVATDAAA